jgi:transposase
MALRGRAMSDTEVETIRQLAHSRTAPARPVARARIVWLAHHGRRVPASAQELPLTPTTVRRWRQRFNGSGLAGLAEKARPGRPARYTPAQVSAVIAVSLTNPRELGFPFASWTLDRLQAYLHEVQGIPMKRTRIDELWLGEGWRWRQQETWCGERVDAACAEKRGASRRSRPRRRRAASSSAWMRWAPKAPRASRGGSWCRSRPQPPQCRRSPSPPPPWPVPPRRP